MPSTCRRGMLAGMANALTKLVPLIKPKRRWAQFSLASMFVVVTVLCRPRREPLFIQED